MNTELFIPKNLLKAINNYYIEVINTITSKKDRVEECKLTYTGIDVFLKFLPEKFKKEFLNGIPTEISSKKNHINLITKKKISKQKLDKLLEHYCYQLKKKEGLKLFIGKDAYSMFTRYKTMYDKQNDYAYLPYSRLSLFQVSNGNGYFQLVDLLYECYLNSRSFKEFITKYQKGLRSKEKFYFNIQYKTIKLLIKYKLFEKLKQHKKINIIDSGTQGGLIFPLYTVLEREGFTCDFSLFASFNWVYPLFKKHVFTKDLYTFLLVEEEGMKEFQKHHAN